MSESSVADQIKNQSPKDSIVSIDRRRSDRREGNPEALDVGMMEKPRRKKQRRRHIDPTTCERDYNEQEIEFMRAMDDYKRAAGRMFPTCSEVLEVIRSLGYVQLTAEQLELIDPRGENVFSVYEQDDEDLQADEDFADEDLEEELESERLSR